MFDSSPEQWARWSRLSVNESASPIQSGSYKCIAVVPSVSQGSGNNGILPPATPNRKRGKSMSFRSGQSGTVVRKGQMWHGRYYVDIPGEKNRRRASMSLGSIRAMTKTEAKRKLRALLEEMGLNEDSHLEHTEAGARTFGTEAAWWKEN